MRTCLSAAIRRCARAGRTARRLALLVGAMALVATAVTGCSSASAESRASWAAGGDATRGAKSIQERGCGTCHVIPGIRGAKGLVGPPLQWMGSRVYIAGRVANDAETMVHWLQSPQAIDPLTAMPNLGLSEQEARDITAYLYTLK